MPRLLRFIPEGGTLVEVTTRTLQGRLLLTPKPLLNRIIVGALARTSQRYGVGIVAAAFVSNHYHLLIRIEDAEQLSNFMALLNSKVAREVGRLTGWTEKVWSRRFQAIGDEATVTENRSSCRMERRECSIRGRTSTPRPGRTACRGTFVSWAKVRIGHSLLDGRCLL